jgi:hypothetical protein
MGDRSEQDGDHLFSASEQPDDEYPVWTFAAMLNATTFSFSLVYYIIFIVFWAAST